MMSDLPGEMMKQILSAPPRTIRSMRYSLTAQGRSMPPSARLPSGSSSFEKASGWIRLPRPAAGTMPHMLSPPSAGLGHGGGGPAPDGTALQRRDQGARAMQRGVLGQRAATPRLGDER